MKPISPVLGFALFCLCAVSAQPAPAPAPTPAPQGPFRLPPLNYSYGALEPIIDERTMEIHHDLHHGGYVKNLNDAVSSGNGKEYASLTLPSMLFDVGTNRAPAGKLGTTIRNNAGGHANHLFFWTLLQAPDNSSLNWDKAPDNSSASFSQPVGELATKINETFGSYYHFKTLFIEASLARFGSGFAWLVYTKNGTLNITTTANQDSPLMTGLSGTPGFETTGFPVLTIDVWEHAYYLKYQNRRVDYVKAFWGIVNWNQAELYYQAAKRGDTLLEMTSKY